MIRRQCTAEYKVKPIKAEVRRQLGYPHPAPIPTGVFVEQWIGISADEASRAKPSDVQYMKNEFPLIGLSGGTPGAGWTRADCLRYLRSKGWGETPKSACVGCPYTGNERWREMRDNRPQEWADALAFDEEIRRGNARAIATGTPLNGTAYLHRSRLPLAQAPINRVTRSEWQHRQTSVFDQAADVEADARGCSPWSCRGEDDED